MSRVIFDSPKLYENNRSYFYEGSSPKLLNGIIDFIEEKKDKIKEIKVSIYLYNNPKLHTYFKDLIKDTDIHILIVSIPLEGYDNKSSQPLTYANNTSKFTKKVTKYHIAKRVYEDILNLNSVQYKMSVFPHMYIRSKFVNPFSRGQMPYSLHNKLFQFNYKDRDVGDVAISSSGFAARDLVKEENLLIIENNKEFYNSSNNYFNDLISNSIRIDEFDNNKKYYEFEVSQCKENLSENHVFIAPFYKDSPIRSEDFLKRLINNVQKRIYIVAQHISSYKYSYEQNGERITKTGFLEDAIKRAKKNEIDVRCLSQTYVDENGDSLGCRRPANIKMFKDFVGAFKKIKNAKYAVNSNVHSKYIIIDNKLIITSCNFTPTQYIYIGNVNIDSFVKMPDLHYKGIHSEVGAYFIIEDKEIIDEYVNNMFDIWQDKSTEIVI